MDEKRCKNCKWFRDEIICMNCESDYYCDLTDDNFRCEKWEAEK